MATTPVSTGVNVSNGSLEDGGLDFATIIPQILEKFVQVIEAAAIIIGSIFLIHYLRKRLQKVEIAHEEQRTAVNLIEKIITGFVVVMAITLALKTVGIDMTLLVSVAILGLSYGLQDIIKNYVAGILILFKAPFKIGDIVKIRDFTGRVMKMDFQATMIQTFDNRHITIYNSDVMTQSIINYSKNDTRRLDFNVTIGYGSDTETALKIFYQILETHAKVLKQPKFSVVFNKFTDMGPAFTLKFWVQRPCNILGIKTEIAKLIAQAFDEKNIMMPYAKGIEAENETALLGASPERQKRIDGFYALPFLSAAAMTPAAATATIPATGPDGQPIPAPTEETQDWEEPE